MVRHRRGLLGATSRLIASQIGVGVWVYIDSALAYCLTVAGHYGMVLVPAGRPRGPQFCWGLVAWRRVGKPVYRYPAPPVGCITLAWGGLTWVFHPRRIGI